MTNYLFIILLFGGMCIACDSDNNQNGNQEANIRLAQNANLGNPTTTGGNNTNDTIIPGLCEKTLTVNAFEEALEVIEEGFMDDDKIKIAKRVCKEICLTSNQVRDIVTLIKMPTAQLNFAKFAYRRTLDKDNYYRVVDVIGFPDDQQQLREFVRSESKTTTVLDTCSNTFTSNAFEEALEVIEEGFMDDDKIRIAKRLCKEICLTSNQVRDIVTLIKMPTAQLNFAKFAFRKALDKDNYYRVVDAIGFPSDQQQLREFVRSES